MSRDQDEMQCKQRRERVSLKALAPEKMPFALSTRLFALTRALYRSVGEARLCERNPTYRLVPASHGSAALLSLPAALRIPAECWH